MNYVIDITVSPESAASPAELKLAAARALKIPADGLSVRVERRAIDARRGRPQIRLTLNVDTDETCASPAGFDMDRYRNTEGKPPVIVVGAGPAGLFAALRLLEHGLRPVILERGKDVSSRKRDIASLTREHRLNPDSNLCFGEGGAGTFSDGKLHTRSNKRGNIAEILQQLTAHGANPDILTESHPHVGTDKLPAVISAIRKTIEDHGGIYRFDTRVTDLLVRNNAVRGVETADGTLYEGIAVILATGHSAHDIYELFLRRKLALETKPFAMGVRVEHPQALIDEIQYGSRNVGLVGDGLLPPASYGLTAQTENRGVFSFCMCPGGIIVPAGTVPDGVVVNGMSNSKRNSPFANAGIVAQIFASDCLPTQGSRPELAGLCLQRDLEHAMFLAAGGTQAAPAQGLLDFLNNRSPSRTPLTSCLSGNTAAPLHALLPAFMVAGLKQAFFRFGKMMHGFLTAEAAITAIESRTSSPVRIPRDPLTLQHIRLEGLYPCGEGAGYAGGITSSAIDGARCADAVAKNQKN